MSSDQIHKRHSCPAKIDEHLHRVHPDDSANAADGCIGERDNRENGDRHGVVNVEDQLERNGGGEQPNAVGRDAGEKEDDRCGFAGCIAESRSEKSIGRGEVTGIVSGKEVGGHENAAKKVAERDLKKSQIRQIGQAGDADKGQCARLGGDDGETDDPPGN